MPRKRTTRRRKPSRRRNPQTWGKRYQTYENAVKKALAKRWKVSPRAVSAQFSVAMDTDPDVEDAVHSGYAFGDSPSSVASKISRRLNPSKAAHKLAAMRGYKAPKRKRKSASRKKSAGWKRSGTIAAAPRRGKGKSSQADYVSRVNKSLLNRGFTSKQVKEVYPVVATGLRRRIPARKLASNIVKTYRNRGLY